MQRKVQKRKRDGLLRVLLPSQLQGLSETDAPLRATHRAEAERQDLFLMFLPVPPEVSISRLIRSYRRPKSLPKATPPEIDFSDPPN